MKFVLFASAKIDQFQAIYEKHWVCHFASMNIWVQSNFLEKNERCWRNVSREISVTFNNQRYDFINDHAQIQLFSQYFWKMKICSWSWWVEFFNPHNVHLWISLLLILKLVFCIKQKKRRFSSKPSRFHVECVKQKHFSNEVS